MTRLASVLAELEAGRRDGIASGLAAVVLHRGVVVHDSFHGAAQTEPTARPLIGGDLFDIASVTKIHVASAVACLVDRGVLGLDDPVGRWISGFDGPTRRDVTVRHLLAHSSGLPAWRPFFGAAAHDPVAGAAFGPPAERPPPEVLVTAFRRGREIVAESIASEPLEAPPGTRAVYSDLGFMALGMLLEHLTGVTLDRIVEAEVLVPLGLVKTRFLPGLEPERLRAFLRGVSFVATRRSLARGDEVLCGAVDDDNAWAVGGTAGHAGLFAPAGEVAAIGQAWLDALAGRSSWLGADTAAAFAARDRTPSSERALGWDTPSASGSTLGAKLGRGPLGAIGHLGFTGTSLWVDRDAELVCALLTNHVHPDGPDKQRIKAFRARFHDAVALDLGMWKHAP